MHFLGNLIWFIFGGWALALSWLVVGLLWCVTIIGIPVGVQCLKMAQLVVWPFGKSVKVSSGSMSLIVNILWWFFGGLELALASVVMGVVFCITIIGIPIGKQHFKLAHLALFPVGAKVV